jgi:hypothetical protein
MIRRFLGLIAVLSFTAALCQAQVSITYSGGSASPNMVDSDLQPLADGNDVEIGYFTPGFLQQNQNNLSALMNARTTGDWHLFGATTITHNFLLPPGSFSSTATQPNSTAATFAGQPIDLWVFKTSDNSAPTASNVVGYGIFSSSDVSWIFPTPGPTPIAFSIDTSQVNQYFHGSAVTGSPGSLEVIAVPEPGSVALLGMALTTGFLWVRRSRQKTHLSH